MITTIQLKRGLEEDWEYRNPVLKVGEPGYATDTKVLKIGDGVTAWNDLEVINEDIVTKFDDLTDTPNEKISKKLVKVSDDGTGLDYTDYGYDEVALKPWVQTNFAKISGDSTQDFTVKDLTIHGTVNHWLGDTITIDDANLQLNAVQNSTRISSGLIIYDSDNLTQLSKLHYDTNNRWRLDSEFIATESYVDNLINGLPDTIDWSMVTSKPTWLSPTTKSTFEAAHSHTWEQVTGKPTTFNPSAHNQAISTITGLQGELDKKADKSQVLTNVPLGALFTDTVYTAGSGISINASTKVITNTSPNVVQTTITGNAGSATKLQTARTINGVSFDGTKNITIVDSTKEPSFTKNTAFNKNFGADAGTVAQGNDSRIINGQTAFGWGNHASAGYIKSYVDTKYTAGNGISISGANVITNTYPNLSNVGNYSDYARKTQNETITGNWRYSSGINTELIINHSIDASAIDRSASLVLGRSASFYIWKISSQSNQSWGNLPNLHFENKTTDTGEWNKMVSILFNGNVGIDNPSPTERLHVVGNGLFTGNITAQKGTLSYLDVNNNTTSEIKVGVANSPSAVNRESSILLGRSLATNQGHFWRIMSSSSSAWANNPSFTIGNNPVSGGAFTNALTILSNRNVGLGINNPTEKLHVEGNGLFTGNITAQDIIGGAGSFIVLKVGTNKVATESWVINNFVLKTSSDIRLKDNIIPIESSLDDILKLNPVHFTYKSDETKTKKSGFIAQELREVYPQFVGGQETDTEYLNIDPASMVSVLTKGMQELIKEVRSLRDELNKVKNNDAQK